MKRFMKVAFCALAAFVGVSFADCAANTAGTYGAITVSTDKNGKCVAVIDGDSVVSTTISNVTVDSVIYKRTFYGTFEGAESPAQTIILPFNAKDSCVTGAKFYVFGGVSDSYLNGSLVWAASAYSISADNGFIAQHAKYGDKLSNHEIWQNTPYLIKSMNHHDGGVDSIFFKSGCSTGQYVLNTNDAKTSVAVEQDIVQTLDKKGVLLFAGTWNFIGTYAKKSFTPSDIGSVYGFAAKNASGATVGQFVKAGEGAYIKPFRAYLTFTAKTAAGAKRAAISSVESINTDLPESIDVVFYDENGAPMSIGHMNTATGSVVMDSRDLWFDLKGRMMDRKPSVKGTYYHKGQKVVIK